MNNIRLSIITVNLNNKRGLEKTCCSIANQTVKPFEWMVIDGGSTDGSVNVIEQYIDYISFWVSEPDQGIYDAFNKGVYKSSGDYTIFINSGDCLANSNVISNLVSSLVRLDDEYDYIVGNMMQDGDSSKIVVPPSIVSASFLFQNYLCCPATLFRTKLLKQIPFRQQYSIAGDWVLSIESLLLYNATYRSIDVLISDFDTHGLSAVHKQDALYERELAWKHLFGERIYDYFLTMTTNLTTLDRIIFCVKQYKSLYALLTTLAIPVYVLYRIRKRFR